MPIRITKGGCATAIATLAFFRLFFLLQTPTIMPKKKAEPTPVIEEQSAAISVITLPEPFASKVDALVRKTKINEERSLAVTTQFAKFLNELAPLMAEAEAIVVTDASDKDGMEAARRKRIELKNIRVAIDKKRKEIKAEAKQYVDLVDGIGGMAKASIETLESHLDRQERFAEIQQKEHETNLAALRGQILVEDGLDAPPGVHLGKISEDEFRQIHENAKLADQMRKQQAAGVDYEAEAIQQQLEKKRIQQLNMLGLVWDGIDSYWCKVTGNRIPEYFLQTASRQDFNERVELVRKVIEADTKSAQAPDPLPTIPMPRQELEPWMHPGAADSDKLLAFVDHIGSIQYPACDHQRAQDLITDLQGSVASFCIEAKTLSIAINSVHVDTSNLKEPVGPDSFPGEDFPDYKIGDEEKVDPVKLDPSHPDWTPF